MDNSDELLIQLFAELRKLAEGANAKGKGSVDKDYDDFDEELEEKRAEIFREVFGIGELTEEDKAKIWGETLQIGIYAPKGPLGDLTPSEEGGGSIFSRLSAKLKGKKDEEEVNVEEKASKAKGGILSKIGGSIGEFVGSIVGGIAAGVSGGLQTLLASIGKGFGGALAGLLKGIAEGLLPLLTSIGKGLGNAFSGLLKGLAEGIKPLLTSIGQGLGGLLRGLASGLMALANPMALLGLLAITAAIIGFGFALKLAAPGIEAFGKLIRDVIGGISDFLKENTEFFLGYFDRVVNVFKMLFDLVKDFFSKYVEVLKSVISGIIDIVGKVLDTVKGIVDSIGNSIQGIIGTVLGGIKGILDTFAGIFDTVGSMFSTIGVAIVNTIEGIVTQLSRVNDLDLTKIASLGPALLSLSAGLSAFTVAGFVDNVVGSISKLFGGDSPFEKIKDLSYAAPNIEKLQIALSKLADIGDIKILENIDAEDIIENVDNINGSLWNLTHTQKGFIEKSKELNETFKGLAVVSDIKFFDNLSTDTATGNISRIALALNNLTELQSKFVSNASAFKSAFADANTINTGIARKNIDGVNASIWNLMATQDKFIKKSTAFNNSFSGSKNVVEEKSQEIITLSIEKQNSEINATNKDILNATIEQIKILNAIESNTREANRLLNNINIPQQGNTVVNQQQNSEGRRFSRSEFDLENFYDINATKK